MGDRGRDDIQQVDLYGKEGVDDAELFALIDDYAAMKGATPKSVEIDEMRLNHLRALGYVVGE